MSEASMKSASSVMKAARHILVTILNARLALPAGFGFGGSVDRTGTRRSVGSAVKARRAGGGAGGGASSGGGRSTTVVSVMAHHGLLEGPSLSTLGSCARNALSAAYPRRSRSTPTGRRGDVLGKSRRGERLA